MCETRDIISSLIAEERRKRKKMTPALRGGNSVENQTVEEFRSLAQGDRGFLGFDIPVGFTRIP